MMVEIKTTEQILEMCEEFHNKLEINKQNNNIILDDPRPLFHKEWVGKESMIKELNKYHGGLHPTCNICNLIKKLKGKQE